MKKYQILAFWAVLIVGIAGLILILKPDWTIRSDGFGYYQYLRSLVFDKDLRFQNETAFFEKTFQVTEKSFYDTPTKAGYWPNPFPVGLSVLEAPWFFLAHFGHRLFHLADSELPGFSQDYALMLNLGNIIYGLLGLVVTYKLLNKILSAKAACIAVALVAFATPFAYFTTYEAIWSHLASFLSVSLFIYCWFIWREKKEIKKYLLLGLLLGAAFLIRWQNLLLAILLLPEFYQYLRASFKPAIKSMLAFFAASLLIASAQLVVWKIIYGSFLIKPESNSTFVNLWHPQILPFLFSPLYGMFAWTPLYVIAFAGLIMFAAKNKKIGYIFLLFLIVQIYLCASLSDWWGGGLGGGSFGARRMLDYSVLYALGIGYVYEFFASNKMKKSLFAGIATILILTNVLLMIQAARGWLDRTNPYSNGYGRALPAPLNFLRDSQKIFKELILKKTWR